MSEKVEEYKFEDTDPIFAVVVNYTEETTAVFPGKSKEELQERLDKRFTKDGLPDYAIKSIEQIAASMEEFKIKQKQLLGVHEEVAPEKRTIH